MRNDPNSRGLRRQLDSLDRVGAGAVGRGRRRPESSESKPQPLTSMRPVVFAILLGVLIVVGFVGCRDRTRSSRAELEARLIALEQQVAADSDQQGGASSSSTSGTADDPKWVKLNGHPSCYAWNMATRYELGSASAVFWSGGCDGDFAAGIGMLVFEWHSEEGAETPHLEFSGELAEGRPNAGRESFRYASVTRDETWWLHGKKHGLSAYHTTSGYARYTPFENGVRHGVEISEGPPSSLLHLLPEGETVQDGPYYVTVLTQYVEGQQIGETVMLDEDGEEIK